MQRNAKLILGILGLSLAGACSRAPVVRERLPDGSYSMKCNDELSACLSHVNEVCKGGPYAVEIAWEQPDTRGVDQNRVESHRSQAIVRCLRRGQDPAHMYARPVALPLGERDVSERPNPTSVPKPAPATVAPSPVAPAPARACVPGTTQACVGAAACAGGQSCLADGSGFGPCDCGSR